MLSKEKLSTGQLYLTLNMLIFKTYNGPWTTLELPNSKNYFPFNNIVYNEALAGTRLSRGRQKYTRRAMELLDTQPYLTIKLDLFSVHTPLSTLHNTQTTH